MNLVLDTSTFQALGTICALRVATSPLELVAARRAAAAARTEIASCERVLSRFDPGSDLSRVNAARGRWVGVDARLVEAVEAALAFRAETGGRCDPLLLPALAAAGYDRSYELLDGHPPRRPPAALGGVEVDARRRRVRVTAGAAIDLGATAKGWIARRALQVAHRAWRALPGALLDLGGDVAVAGSPPEGGPWLVDVEDPFSRGVLGTIALVSGGVATSGPARRRFGPHRSLHHLIDPATRAPADGGPVAVTVVAPDPVAADAHATALAVAAVADAERYLTARPALGAVLAIEPGSTRVLGDVQFTPAAEREVAL